MTDTIQTLRVARTTDAVSAQALRTLDGAALGRWLLRRRWFGAKGGAPRSVRVGTVIPVQWEGGAGAVVTLEVLEADGARSRWQLPLAVCPLGPGARYDGQEAIASVEGSDGSAILVDATTDAGFRRALAHWFGEGGHAFEGDGARWSVKPLGAGPALLRTAPDAKVSSAEQSNTSIVFGDRAILKLFRRLEHGESPDVELTRALTRELDFAYTPPLLGTIALEAGGETVVAGMLQRFVAGSTDAWAWILAAARPDFDRDGSLDETASAVRQLGRVTRAMHDALARASGEAMEPETATPADVQRWADAARTMVERSLALLAGNAAASGVAGAAEALARREELVALPARLAADVGDDAGQRTRHHGDYHLGQVLRAPEGAFFVIDFEGEPARPLAERRERQSPLRDVAGMLRSFGYAAATLAGASGSGDRAERWEREARTAFLDGYFAGAAAPFLPRERAHADALITLFETEKVFYELAYELNNRPTWSWIPLGGIARLTSPAR